MAEQLEEIAKTKRVYLEALTTGDALEASKAIDLGLRTGISPMRLYMRVLMPAQIELGELWHKGRISISQEHLATQITLNEMTRLRLMVKPKVRLGLKAVIACVEGDSHFLGARVVADMLYVDGWDVDFLGPNNPVSDLTAFAQNKQPDLMGFAATLDTHMASLKDTIASIRALKKAPKIMIGGPALSQVSSEAIAALGADGVAVDAEEAVQVARKLCGLDGPNASLSQYLRGLGMRITGMRKARKFSQQELAKSAGLDRAYISALENGKQNLTIGVVFKLAQALEVSMEDLLVDGSSSL